MVFPALGFCFQMKSNMINIPNVGTATMLSTGIPDKKTRESSYFIDLIKLREKNFISDTKVGLSALPINYNESKSAKYEQTSLSLFTQCKKEAEEEEDEEDNGSEDEEENFEKSVVFDTTDEEINAKHDNKEKTYGEHFRERKRDCLKRITLSQVDKIFKVGDDQIQNLNNNKPIRKRDCVKNFVSTKIRKEYDGNIYYKTTTHNKSATSVNQWETHSASRQFQKNNTQNEIVEPQNKSLITTSLFRKGLAATTDRTSNHELMSKRLSSFSIKCTHQKDSVVKCYQDTNAKRRRRKAKFIKYAQKRAADAMVKEITPIMFNLVFNVLWWGAITKIKTVFRRCIEFIQTNVFGFFFKRA